MGLTPSQNFLGFVKQFFLIKGRPSLAGLRRGDAGFADGNYGSTPGVDMPEEPLPSLKVDGNHFLAVQLTSNFTLGNSTIL